ncbi:hypothetical protein HY388_00035 [Candidatus Daviesbacteria bacterium]|nr:hypothetical protein [Candidatus Daviesbacteria bacterium]
MKEPDQNNEIISKHNRQQREEAQKAAQVFHPPLLYRDRPRSRKERDKALNLLIKKVRKSRRKI